MYFNQIVGKAGEEKATKYLKEKGDSIIEKNFRCREGEVDIIAKDKNKDLVFVEVKTRRTIEYGFPSEAVNHTKQNHIQKVAKYYILKNKVVNSTIRFDIIEILIGKTYFIHHIKQAF